MGACPPSQLGLFTRREGLLVNEQRVIEYSRDRLNQQIRELMRENSALRETMFHKDKHLMKLEAIHSEAEDTVKVLSIGLGLTLIGLMGLTLWVLNVMQGVKP